MNQLKVLIVEDSEDDLLLLLHALKNGGFESEYLCVENREDMLKALEDEQWQVVISDHAMPCFSAPEALETLKESGQELPFIIVSGTIEEKKAQEIIKAGAQSYITKENLSALIPELERAIKKDPKNLLNNN